jgi:hypothetical protein
MEVRQRQEGVSGVGNVTVDDEECVESRLADGELE